jgi:hypothetical protein
LSGVKGSPDQTLLHLSLKPLDDASGPDTPTLDSSKNINPDITLTKRFDDVVRGFNSVLNCIVNADASDWRHDMSRIANENDPRFIPLFHPA